MNGFTCEYMQERQRSILFKVKNLYNSAEWLSLAGALFNLNAKDNLIPKNVFAKQELEI